MNLSDFRGRHSGARAYVLGNGPSLATADLSGLKDEITFTCNRGHLIFPRLGGPSTYWSIEDELDAYQFGPEFAAMQGPIKFVPEDLAVYNLGDHVSIPFIRDRFLPEFPPKFAIEPPFYWGATVSYLLLQLAAFMGCTELILLGHDFRYIPKGVTVGETWIINSVDVNHFDPSYWPAGSRAFAPDFVLMRTAFLAAYRTCSERGIRIMNATANSALDVFPF